MASSGRSRGRVAALIPALCVVTLVVLGVGSDTEAVPVGWSPASNLLGTDGSAEAEQRNAALDRAAEIRVRALADAATLGVSGAGCDGPLRGSGFVVGDATYTNRHLVEGGVVVKFDQLVEPVIVPLAAVASGLDLAIAPAVDAVSLEFAAANPTVGAPVLVAGHAGGGQTTVLVGRVHLYGRGSDWGVDGNVMLIDVATEPGFSGGPVLDEHGAVVAMLQGFEPTIGLTLAIPVDDLRSWSPSDAERAEAPMIRNRCNGSMG